MLYIIEYYSSINKDELEAVIANRWTLRRYLSEINQTHMGKYHTVSLV